MKQEKTTAIILKRTDYGEADRILHLLTPLGRRSVLARGVRKERSKLAGGIELLSESEVVLRQGRGEMSILTSARMKYFYHDILQDYDRMTFAYEVLRAAARASVYIDDADWYDCVSEVLRGLNDSAVSLALVKVWFYIQYASLGGYELSLYRDIEGNPIDVDATYQYDDGERGLRRIDRGTLSSNHIKIMRLLAAKPLHIVAQVSGMQEYLADCITVSRRHAALDG